MVIDKAPGATLVMIVMIGSVAADVMVLGLFADTTLLQKAGVIGLEAFTLVALILAGRNYYRAREEHDHYVAAEHIAAMLPKEEREDLLTRTKEATFPPRVRGHIEALLKQ